MTEPKSDRTSSGRTLTDEEIDALSDEVAETDHDVEALKTRRRADVVPARIDPKLRAAIEARRGGAHHHQRDHPRRDPQTPRGRLTEDNNPTRAHRASAGIHAGPWRDVRWLPWMGCG